MGRRYRDIAVAIRLRSPFIAGTNRGNHSSCAGARVAARARMRLAVLALVVLAACDSGPTCARTIRVYGEPEQQPTSCEVAESGYLRAALRARERVRLRLRCDSRSASNFPCPP